MKVIMAILLQLYGNERTDPLKGETIIKPFDGSYGCVPAGVVMDLS